MSRDERITRIFCWCAVWLIAQLLLIMAAQERFGFDEWTTAGIGLAGGIVGGMVINWAHKP